MALQNPVYIDMFSALGGSAVPIAWGETFTAVQQGTIDGLEIPIAVIDSSKYNEVTKFLSLTNRAYSMIALLISKKSFDKLPVDLQNVVREAGEDGPGRAARRGRRERQGPGRNAGEEGDEGERGGRHRAVPQFGQARVRDQAIDRRRADEQRARSRESNARQASGGRRNPSLFISDAARIQGWPARRTLHGLPRLVPRDAPHPD